MHRGNGSPNSKIFAVKDPIMAIKTIEGALSIRKARFCLVAARFNSFVVESLLSGAVDTLKRHGAEEPDITIVRVPGAFEMPLVLEKIAAKGNYDAIVALGAVIRGGLRISNTLPVNVSKVLHRSASSTPCL